jgi:deoxyribonuclease-4
MPLGAHLPTSKGFLAALQHAQDLGCDCLQIFCKSPRQWNAPPLDNAKATTFRDAWRASGFIPLVAHDSYLINLAAPDEALRQKSIDAMIDEVERSEALGCDYLVTHCGAHLQKDCADDTATRAAALAGLNRLAQSLQQVLDATPGYHVRIALENTAAQGTCLGGPFEHLATVLQELPEERMGVCIDTCHSFAAGYDVATSEGLNAALRELDETVGLDRVSVVHLNDSKGALGRHLDRHEHIGQGLIGREAMQRIVTEPRLAHLPFILETPEVETMVRTNLDTVRSLRQL